MSRARKAETFSSMRVAVTTTGSIVTDSAATEGAAPHGRNIASSKAERNRPAETFAQRNFSIPRIASPSGSQAFPAGE